HHAFEDRLAAVRDLRRAQRLAGFFDGKLGVCAHQGCWSWSLTLLRLLQAALEALDLARRIDEALLTSKERMARRAYVDVQPLLGRAGLPGVAAAAGHGS